MWRILALELRILVNDCIRSYLLVKEWSDGSYQSMAPFKIADYCQLFQAEIIELLIQSFQVSMRSFPSFWILCILVNAITVKFLLRTWIMARVPRHATSCTEANSFALHRVTLVPWCIKTSHTAKIHPSICFSFPCLIQERFSFIEVEETLTNGTF